MVTGGLHVYAYSLMKGNIQAILTTSSLYAISDIVEITEWVRCMQGLKKKNSVIGITLKWNKEHVQYI